MDKQSLFSSKFIPNNVNINGQSLIDFKAVKIDELPAANWLFFTSKNSVRFFFKHNFNISKYKLACVGSGTYKELAKHASKIDFIGNDVNVKKVGKSFSEKVGNGTVVFPVSNISKGTIQQFFQDKSKIQDLITYNTFEKGPSKPINAQVLIFTSPSNVRAYLKNQQIRKDQTVISIGPSTGSELLENSIDWYILPKTTGELGLIDLIPM